MSAPSPFRRSIGVMIGIDHYADGIPALRTAVNDARRLGEMLSTLHGYEVISLLDGDATHARITALLTTELPAQVTADDRVLFYFAGHGVARDGDEGPNGYLLPVDAQRSNAETYLHMPLVHDALLALPCRHMLVVLDSCFSGAFRWSGTRRITEEVTVVHQEKYDRFVQGEAWQVITSAAQDQLAIDQLSASALGQRDGEGDHSPFALALFDAIAGKGDLVPRGEGDGLVTATELYLYVEESLQQVTAAVGKSQKPCLWPLKKHGKGEFVFFVPGRDLTLPPAPPLTFERNPWIGLASYDASNAALFFGRDAEIAALREKITKQALTVVLGASGTGKSSLVKAGAVPRLQADGWHVLPVMRPGSTPMAALAQALGGEGTAAVAVAATPEAITTRLAALVAQHAPKPVLLVIDQFEELITLARSAEARAAMLSLLATLVSAHPDGFRLVVTIRTDFEPNFDRTAFGDAWTAGRFVIPPMSRDNMRAVIEQPATARVLYFEPSDLVDTLLDEVVATPGALPLLSFALSEMYIAFVKRQSGDRAITRADYDVLGGVAGALRSRAESEYAALDEAHRATLRRVMLRLVTGDGAGVARRRATDAELEFSDAAERSRATHVVQRLTEARLLVEGREADGESFVEPAHDALVRGWGRLLEWMRDEGNARFPLLQQQRLARAAQEWERTGGDTRDGQLWRDAARSAQLSPLVRDRALWLNVRELAFAKRSIRGRNIARASTAAAVVLIALGGVVATIAGLRANRRAEEVRVTSIIRTAQTMATEDPLLAALLLGSIDSGMVSGLDDGARLSLIGTAMQLRRGAQVDMTVGNGSPISYAEVSPDGDWLMTADASRVPFKMYHLPTGTWHSLPSMSSQEHFVLAAFDQASTQVALGTTTGRVTILPVQEGKADETPPGVQDHLSPVLSLSAGQAVANVSFNPAGTALLTVDTTGLLLVHDLVAARTMSPFSAAQPGAAAIWRAEGITDAMFLRDGRFLLLRENTLELHEADGRSVLRSALVDTLAVVSMHPSPDGRRVALGIDDGSIRLVTLQKPVRVSRIDPRGGELTAMAWSPDGTQLASAGADAIVKLWDTRSLTLRRRFERTAEPMSFLRFSDDGSRFIGASPYTYRAVVFDTAGGALTMAGHTSEILDARVVQHGRRYVTVSRDGGIWLWSPPPPPLHQATETMEAEHPIGGNVQAIAFSPDSRQVVLGNLDGWIYRYRIDSLTPAVPFARDTGTLRALQWSPDGQWLHALTYSGERFHWSMRGDVPVRRRSVGSRDEDFLLDVMPAKDGRHALALSTDGAAMVWDLADSTPPLRIPIVPGDIVCRDPQDPKFKAGMQGTCLPLGRQCAVMSADARWIASCESGTEVLLQTRDASTPTRSITLRSRSAEALAPNARGTALALSHDGALLATGLDTAVRIWRTAQPADTGRVLRIGNLTVQQLVFSPDAHRLAARNVDGWVRVVDVRTGALLLTVRPRGDSLEAMRFTPDSRYLITLGIGENEARLWNVSGSGGSLPVSAGGLLVEALEVSPDGRWLVVSNDAQGAQLQALDADLAITPFRRLRTCLTASQRQRYLLESEPTASDRVQRCQERVERDDAAIRR